MQTATMGNPLGRQLERANEVVRRVSRCERQAMWSGDRDRAERLRKVLAWAETRYWRAWESWDRAF